MLEIYLQNLLSFYNCFIMKSKYLEFDLTYL